MKDSRLDWLDKWRPMNLSAIVPEVESAAEFGTWFFHDRSTPVVCYFDCDDEYLSMVEFMERYQPTINALQSEVDKEKPSQPMETLLEEITRLQRRRELIDRVRASWQAGEVCLTQMRKIVLHDWEPRYLRYLVHKRGGASA